MFYVILENGGKQYKAIEGERLEVDLLAEEIGKKMTFDKVLLLVNDAETQVGMPYIRGASVDCTVLEHFKGEKVAIFKYRPKQRYRVKTGHRQSYTRVIVDSIAFPGKADSVKATEPAPEKTETPLKKGRSKPASAAKKAAAKPAAKKAPAPKKSAAIEASAKPAAQKSPDAKSGAAKKIAAKPAAKKSPDAKSGAAKKTTKSTSTGKK